MNEEIKSTKTSEAQKRATAKYDAENSKKMTFKFSLKYDADILDKFASVPNKSAYLKELIRRDIANN